MIECTEPRQDADSRYVSGVDCTWHGPIAEAAARRDGRPCCPKCGGLLNQHCCEDNFAAYLRGVESAELREMVVWGRGRCFPDPDTLLEAYRQAMQGEM